MTLYADLFRYRELFLNLFRRELRVKYRGSLLGVAWSLVNPLVLVGVYTLVFSVLWKAFSIPHYPLFLVSGLLVWIFVQSSLQCEREPACAGEPRQAGQVPAAAAAACGRRHDPPQLGVMLAVILPLNLIAVPETRSTFWVAILLSVPLIALVSGLSIMVGRRDRRVPRCRAPAGDGALAVVLPDAGLLHLRPAAQDRPEALGGRHPPLRELRHAAAARDPGSALLRPLSERGDAVYTVCAAVVALALAAFVFQRVDDQLAVAL